MTIADLIVEQLIRCGVQHVFGVGGANIEDLFAAIQRRRPAIRAVLTKHEHGAASAAAGYARVRGGLGVVLATSGSSTSASLTREHPALAFYPTPNSPTGNCFP